MPAQIPALHDLARGAVAEIGDVLGRIPPADVERLCDELLAARRIVVFGMGREGLMVRALAMRLVHLGLDAHVVGDMSTPPVGPADLFVASVGPGTLSTAEALLGVARRDGARTLVVTGQPDGPAPRGADTVVHVPAQTMADDGGGSRSVLPMGSLFEAAELVLFDLVSILLRERTGGSAEEMRARHTNLE